MNSIFEASMLLCFGISWPISIAKSLRTRVVTGKSPAFMTIVAIGYSCGVLHKVFYSPDKVMILYVLNLILVCTDLMLYHRYKNNTPPASA